MIEDSRPRRRAIWIAVAVVTAVVIVVPLGVRIWGRLLRQTRTDAVSYRHPIRALEIDSPNGVVTIGAGPAGQVNVRRTLTWTLSRPNVRQTWEGATLRIDVSCRRAEPYSSLECGTDLDLRVPADVAVRASVASGEIDVRNIAGGLRLRTTAGIVRMTGVSGRTWARSGSGIITGAALTAPTVDAGVTSGEIRLGFTDPPDQVTAATTSGTMSIGVPPGFRYRVGGRTASGSRHIDPALVDAGSSRAITLTTMSGAVTLGYPPLW
jgi:putative adhesin